MQENLIKNIIRKGIENMLERLRSVTNKKMFHLVMVIVIIAVILFAFGIMLKVKLICHLF